MRPLALAILWVGVVGLAEFGTLLLAVRCLHVLPSASIGLNIIRGRSRRRRLNRWIRLAPALATLSGIALIAGAILFWTGGQ